MSAGGARRGRRDNGLDAAEYAVAGDVDPRVGERLLDVLAAGGIAAYLQPSADLNPVTRSTIVPPRPVDRLYVDRSHLATARDYLIQLSDEDDDPPPGPDVDAEWARIVAGYHREVTADRRTWPAAEDLSEPAPDGTSGTANSGAGTSGTGNSGTSGAGTSGTNATSDGTSGTGTLGDDGTAGAVSPGGSPAAPGADGDADPPARSNVRLPSAVDISGVSVGPRDASGSLLDGLDAFGSHLPGDDREDRYVPPPPPPLPRLSKYAVAGVLAITGGFLLFIFPTLLPIGHGLATAVGFIGILVGFVTLIWRLRPGDDPEDYDPDDGAVV